MSMIRKILAALALLAAGVALWFRSQRDQARARIAQGRAAAATAAVKAKDRARQALQRVRRKQDAEPDQPDTEARDDLEGGW